MTYLIDPDVRRIAKRFGVDAKLIQGVVTAEGNILKAVQCSLPAVTTREEALEVTCRSAAHAMSDYLRSTGPDAFVKFWGARWAPIGAENDPRNLNRHWIGNVLRGWLGVIPATVVSKADVGSDLPGGGAV